jgi:hypothetical protein
MLIAMPVLVSVAVFVLVGVFVFTAMSVLVCVPRLLAPICGTTSAGNDRHAEQ